jgi:TPR repeat protein
MIWFGRAAAQAHPIAMLHLGAMYAEGRGVPQDYVRAHMWFSLAAAQGEQRAAKTLTEMAERRMTPAQIAEAQKLARDWKPATQPRPR